MMSTAMADAPKPAPEGGPLNRDHTREYDWSSFDGDEMSALGSLARTMGFGEAWRPMVIVKRDLSDERLIAAAQWLLEHQRFPLDKEPHHALVCRALTWTDQHTPHETQEALMRIAERRRRQSTRSPRAGQ